jgi:hypothetical protein
VHTASTPGLLVATIIINKVTSPSGGTGFRFTDDVVAPNSFGLDDGQEKTFLNVSPGAYTVTENDPAPAYALTELTCVDPDGGSSVNLGTRTVSIDLDAGETVECTFTNTSLCFTDVTATGAGEATLCSAGGGAACRLTEVEFIPLAGHPLSPGSPPKGVVFPYGLFHFVADLCTPGSTVDLTLTLPSPMGPSTEYWKYGPTASDPTDHWYVLPANVAGNTVTFSITDGGLGDDDLAANGTIEDQGGPGVVSAPIPTLSTLPLLLLAGLVALLGAGLLRRQVG